MAPLPCQTKQKMRTSQPVIHRKIRKLDHQNWSRNDIPKTNFVKWDTIYALSSSHHTKIMTQGTYDTEPRWKHIYVKHQCFIIRTSFQSFYKNFFVKSFTYQSVTYHLKQIFLTWLLSKTEMLFSYVHLVILSFSRIKGYTSRLQSDVSHSTTIHA